MPNRAAAIRGSILSADPGAVVEARGPNWIRHRLTNGRRALDTSISPLHYNGTQEIDTDFANSDVGAYDDMTTATSYQFYQRDGDRRFYPRRSVTTEYIDLGRPEFQRPNLTWAAIPWTGKTRSANVITFTRADARMEIVTGPGRLKINLVLLSLPAATRWRFPATLTGLTRQGRALIADSDGTTVATLAAFTLDDAVGVSRAVSDQLTSHPTYQGAYQIEPNLSGLTYPVVIDPTLDINVAANADDGYWVSDGTFFAAANVAQYGNATTTFNSFFRFTGVTVPRRAAITAAYITVVAQATRSSTTCNINVYAEDADSPAAVTTAADANGRAVTAAVAWSGVSAQTSGTSYQTPSIVAAAQTVVNRNGWTSGNAMQWFFKDNSSSLNALRSAATLDHATLVEPILHIDYVTPLARPLFPQPWRRWTQRRQG